MKKFFTLTIVGLLAIAPVFAQTPYKHSVGVIAGSFNGLSYKCFPTNNPNLAFQCDLGINMFQTCGRADAYFNGELLTSEAMNFPPMWGFKANPNLLYQQVIDEWNWGGISWFAGGGVSLGTLCGDLDIDELGYRDNIAFGVNGMAGIELGLDDAPLAISFDFRPGYGAYCPVPHRHDSPIRGTTITSYFDWSLSLGLRYTL